MKPKIKYDVNVLGMKNKKSMMRARMVLSLKLKFFFVPRLFLVPVDKLRIPTWTQTDRVSAIFFYVLLRCRVAVYISNVSVQDKVFFFGSKNGINKR